MNHGWFYVKEICLNEAEIVEISSDFNKNNISNPYYK